MAYRKNERGLYVDDDKTNYAINFIQCLKHTKGEWYGLPFDLIDWQEEFIRDVFGTINTKTGYRQYNTAYLEVPKKQGKSEIGAGLALLLTCGDGEYAAEVYGCATDKEQASIIFDVAVAMVDQCPALKKRMKLVLSRKRMIYTPTNSVYRVLSADVKNKHGFNVSGCIFDELHAQPNRDLWDVMTKGAGDARRQPLTIALTTAGTDRNSICFEQHQKALDVASGRRNDPTFYGKIYGLTEEDDWEDEANWYKANPSLGQTVDIEKVRQFYQSVKGNPVEENQFKQLRLNIWVKQSVRWMQMDEWDKNDEVIDPDMLIGRECYAGLDLSSTLDLTAFVLVFPPRNDGEKYIFLAYYWIPEDNMHKRSNKDHVPYDKWYAEGNIYATEGNVVDYRYIEKTIKDIASKYVIKEIAYDRYNATQIILNLQDEGLTMVPFGQGFKDMSPPTKVILSEVLHHNIIHNNHPVLRWNFENVYVKTDAAGNLKPDKEKSTEKIDGAVAAIMAYDRATKHTESGSVYDDRGLLVI